MFLNFVFSCLSLNQVELLFIQYIVLYSLEAWKLIAVVSCCCHLHRLWVSASMTGRRSRLKRVASMLHLDNLSLFNQWRTWSILFNLSSLGLEGVYAPLVIQSIFSNALFGTMMHMLEMFRIFLDLTYPIIISSFKKFAWFVSLLNPHVYM